MAKKIEDKEPMPIAVSFRPRIRTDGELTRVMIEQNGKEIQLTHEQARTLVLTISARCSLPSTE